MVSNFDLLCGYSVDQLYNEVYLANESDIGFDIDNGNAYALLRTGATLNKIDCLSVTLEDTSEYLGERYQFTHQLTFSVVGYANVSIVNNRYYFIVKTKDNNEYWILNPKFPSKLTYSYTLDYMHSITTFTAATVSNFPMLFITSTGNLPTYPLHLDYERIRIDDIKLIERQNVKFYDEFAAYTDNEGFSSVDYIKNTAKFTESFDSEKVTHTLEFNIPMTARKDDSLNSWHYRLLEFNDNTYAAVVKASDENYFMSGFEMGLQPTFSVKASSSAKEPNMITITLQERYSSGLLLDNMRNAQIIKYGDPLVRTTSGAGYCDIIMRLVSDVTASTSTDNGVTWSSSTETVVIANRSDLCSLKNLPFMIYNSGNTTGSVSWNARFEMSRDNSTWTDVYANTEISIPSNQAVYFRLSYGTIVPNSFKLTTNSGNLILCGNIMSLLYRTNFADVTNISANSIFSSTFMGCTHIKEADRLILPATTLSNYCYKEMFKDCTNLTTAPELPATTLAVSCYENMFYGCTELTTAPNLPATTTAGYCYSGMFLGCKKLVSAPTELPAKSLTLACYQGMFQGCSALTTAPVLPASRLVIYCYQLMFANCRSLNYIKCLAESASTYPLDALKAWTLGVGNTGTFVKKANVSWQTGDNGIPSGWRVVGV